MTKLLSKAFRTAAKLPAYLQDELARQLMEDLQAEIRWSATLHQSQHQLEKLSEKALEDFRQGRTMEAGFDEL